MIPDSLGATFARIKEIQGLLDHLNPEAATQTPTPTSTGTFQEALATQLRPADAARMGAHLPTATTSGFALPASEGLDNFGASPLADIDSRGWEDNLPSAKLAEQVLTGQGAPSSHGSDAVPAAYRRMVKEAARKYGVDESLILAVMQTESDFNPTCVSSAGAMGLMQLMPGNVEEYGISDAFDPAQNIDAGVRHLRDMLQRYNGDVELALAGYNAGPGNVAKYGGVPPFAETRNYIPKVLSRATAFRQQPASAAPAPTAPAAGAGTLPHLDPVSPMPASALGHVTVPTATVAQQPGTAERQTSVGETVAVPERPAVAAPSSPTVVTEPAADAPSSPAVVTEPASDAHPATRVVSPQPPAAAANRSQSVTATATGQPPVAARTSDPPFAETSAASLADPPPAAATTAPALADAPRPAPTPRPDQTQAPLIDSATAPAADGPQATPAIPPPAGQAQPAAVPEATPTPSAPIDEAAASSAPQAPEQPTATHRAELQPQATPAAWVRTTTVEQVDAPPAAETLAANGPVAEAPASRPQSAGTPPPATSQPVNREAREQALLAAAQAPIRPAAPNPQVVDAAPIVATATAADAAPGSESVETSSESAPRVRVAVSREAAEPLLRSVVERLPGVAAAQRAISRAAREIVEPVREVIEQLADALGDGPDEQQAPATTPAAANPTAARTLPDVPDRTAAQQSGNRAEPMVAPTASTMPVAPAGQGELGDGGQERSAGDHTTPVESTSRADGPPAVFSLDQAAATQHVAHETTGRSTMTLDQPQDLTSELVRRARLIRSPGRDEFTVDLRHPEAGAVSVRVVRQAETLHITLTCSHNGLRRELQAQMPALQEALRQQGLELGSFDTATPQQHQSGTDGSGQPRQQSLPRQQEATTFNTYTPPTGGDDDTRPTGGGGLAVWA